MERQETTREYLAGGDIRFSVVFPVTKLVRWSITLRKRTTRVRDVLPGHGAASYQG